MARNVAFFIVLTVEMLLEGMSLKLFPSRFVISRIDFIKIFLNFIDFDQRFSVEIKYKQIFFVINIFIYVKLRLIIFVFLKSI